MNEYEYILTKQISWAQRNNIKLVGSKITKGRRAYTEDLNKNLFEPLQEASLKELQNGDGNELQSNSNTAAKMCAVHSSSAICINVLQYWKNKNIPNLAYCLGLCSKSNTKAKEIHFEQKYVINKSFKFPPNLDAVILNDKNSKIKAYGIECKFSEAYSSYKHPGLKSKYLTEVSKEWKNIPNLHCFAKEISPDDNLFSHLHPAQLIKHILGLKKEYGKSGFKLLYLWYDVPGKAGCKHRTEIEKFAQIVKMDNINFTSISYQELIIKMKNNFYDGNEKYLDYLTARYL